VASSPALLQKRRVTAFAIFVGAGSLLFWRRAGDEAINV